MNNARRGEIWLVDFDPTRGSEMKKTRLVLVISSDAVGVLPIKLGVPITEWLPSFANHLWHLRLELVRAFILCLSLLLGLGTL